MSKSFFEIALIGALLILPGCPDDEGLVPSVSRACTFAYEMTGSSMNDAEFYRGEEVIERIEISAAPKDCREVGIHMQHRDDAARLQVPHENCVNRVSEEDTDEVWFTYEVSCGCTTPWDWIVTDKAPPVYIPVEITPVQACG